MELRHPSSREVRKLKTSVDPTSFTAFWDVKVLGYTKYMQKDTTINSESYCDIHQKLKTYN